MGIETGVALAMGGQMLGGITQAFGQLQEGKAAQQQAAYASTVLRRNKLIADNAAEDVMRRGAVAVQERQVATAQTIGNQRATLAGRGVKVDQDTALVIAEDAARLGKLDEIQIADNARREALSLRMQGANFETQAELSDRVGSQAVKNSRMAAFGTLLGTAGSVSSKWMTFNASQGET